MVHITVLKLASGYIYVYVGKIDFSSTDYMNTDPFLEYNEITEIIEEIDLDSKIAEYLTIAKYSKICSLNAIRSTSHQNTFDRKTLVMINNIRRYGMSNTIPNNHIECSERSDHKNSSERSELLCLVLRDGDITRARKDVLAMFPTLLSNCTPVENKQYGIPAYFLDISMTKFKALTNALNWRHNYNPFMPTMRKYIERFHPDIRYSFMKQTSQAICLSKDTESGCWYISDNNQNIYGDGYRNYTIGSVNFTTYDCGVTYIAFDEKNAFDGTTTELYNTLDGDCLLYNDELYCIIAKF